MANSAKLPADEQSLARIVQERTGLKIYEASATRADDGGAGLVLGRQGTDKTLVAITEASKNVDGFTGKEVKADGLSLWLCPRDVANGLALQKRLSWLQPRTLGLATSFGAGDRLGLATPGHVQAIRKSTVRPIFCQQSIREMRRTGRTAEEVMADACWGAFQAGWREGFGADADHLKTTVDIDRCWAAGFTFYTVDPGEHVDSGADTADHGALAEKYESLPWKGLATTAADCRQTYAGKKVSLDGPKGKVAIEIGAEALLRAAVKYGRAVAHVKAMFEHLKSVAGGKPFEFEVSVDETATPTTTVEHYYVAAELKRLGVSWVSLAPRFVGDFEKGVDYIGDLDELRATLAEHAAVARTLGPYKLSLHSGSDKFSVYPIAAELAGNMVHVKTAGTSYLEALRAIAKVNPGLFREILAYARQRYPEDRATYHVSADVNKVVDGKDVSDAALPEVLDQFDTREACHVTFGSVLRDKAADGSWKFRDRFFQTLREHEQVYYDILEAHIGRHLAPFTK